MGSHATTENLNRNGEFTVAFATVDTLTASDYVGIVSGKTHPDKIKNTGWKAEKAEKVNAPVFDCKMLTNETQSSLTCINAGVLKAFRNMIDHTYEKINKKYLKAYIFSMIEPRAITEIKSRINYCNENAE